MDAIMELARALSLTPAIFPWVVFITLAVIAWKERHLFREFFQSKLDGLKEAERFNATYAELVRNNTAALENNTAALEMVTKDREVLNERLAYHEKLSEARHDKLETVVNRIDERTADNREDIVRISERNG